jgi:hypothetical protein
VVFGSVAEIVVDFVEELDFVVVDQNPEQAVDSLVYVLDSEIVSEFVAVVYSVPDFGSIEAFVAFFYPFQNWKLFAVVLVVVSVVVSVVVLVVESVVVVVFDSIDSDYYQHLNDQK